MTTVAQPDAGTPTRASGLTLGAAARDFLRHRSPRLLLRAVLVSVVLRLIAGRWQLRDAVVTAVLLVVQPFTEWLIHVYVLHFRPRTIAGRRVDPAAGRSHRRHHEAPRDPQFIFIDVRVHYVTFPLSAVLWAGVLLGGWRASIGTGVTVALALTLLYEWTHFLIHSDYVPRSRFYRGLWRAHRLHHFRNENYWYGVTHHLGDRVLRTYPAKDNVPLSPTARTLAGLLE